MAGHLNKASLIGNLGRDPEIRTTRDGLKIANFSIATTESWKDKNSGEKKERTNWHNIVIFNEPIAKVAEQYLKKGSKVYIEGSIETRKYEKDGQDRYTTEIVLRPFNGQLILLGDAGGGNRAPQNDDYDRGGSSPMQRGSGQMSEIINDDIPF